jgi:hypothetical protein
MPSNRALAGEFIPWVEQNCLFNRKTAHKYMQVYAHQDEFKCLPNETFASAYRLLSSPKKTSSENPNREQRGPNVSHMRHLDPVTPRNDSEPEIVTDGEPVDEGPPIDTSDSVFLETHEEEDLLPGRGLEVIELSGLKPLNWSQKGPEEAKTEPSPPPTPSKAPESVEIAPLLPPEEPLDVLVIRVTDSEEEVIEVAEESIWDVMKRYPDKKGLKFVCGVGVQRGEWEKPDLVKEERKALPASWVRLLAEARTIVSDGFIEKFLKIFMERKVRPLA